MTLIQGDCVEVMRSMPEASVDAVVTDPPYGLEFMGKQWDRLWDKRGNTEEQDPSGYVGSDGVRCKKTTAFSQHSTRPTYQAGYAAQAWHEAWAREVLRVLKPGGYLLAFGGTRTVHRLTCAIEDAGFEIRDRFLHLRGGDAIESIPGEIAWVYGSG